VLYDRYFDDIYNYVARRVGNTDVGGGHAAAPGGRARRSKDSNGFRGGPFWAWLFRIAGNLVTNHHRVSASMRQVGLDAAGGVSPPVSTELDRAEELRLAIARLSELDQEVITLCYFAGLSPKEIAPIVGASDPAVHKRLNRARARLRSYLEGREPDGE
jgi:RNA polymerase sigma-70 factor (ECF subfamily)